MKTSIPISAARQIAKSYDQDQVIVIGFQKVNILTNVATYGKTITDCDQVAQAGNWLKEFLLKWPKGECQAEPNRVQLLRQQIADLKQFSAGLQIACDHLREQNKELQAYKDAVEGALL